jgi:hypothetical protein
VNYSFDNCKYVESVREGEEQRKMLKIDSIS